MGEKLTSYSNILKDWYIKLIIGGVKVGFLIKIC